ncbi:Peptidyl-prolyl cis-trans isomerase FKBP16-4, chloroplastic [Gracilariopsis chorda]|uniref:peptidylprolyl isomerase n=1 Tax=Gracilariopsis chorda TaxID=448386 RepID=A0A2V3IEK3_9FLOR|nr:Peptidyl-prolyl cis-trans isomerase FKBP16-4, chloroplastic [Gracilariopsis chorda]|eukprot:PXF40482.1 Peptidyl-prolyl cis-trans isomerase FKBP16-4, chloroplastic [Gracilariopsis chorda]
MISPGSRSLQLPAFSVSPFPHKSVQSVRSNNICACSPQSNPRRIHAPTTLSRRNLLAITAAIAATTALPEQSFALTKKRILAKAGPLVELPSGVTYRDVTIGKGYEPRNGDTVAIHYSLFYKDLEVESSRESQGLAASPLGFTFGATSGPGSIMRGVTVGMEGMRVGGLRLITVPPELAYGAKGKAPLIPGNSTVDFAVSLLSCKRAGTNPSSMANPKAQAY